jgi:hypothetical protein
MEAIVNNPAWVGVLGTLAGGILVGCFALLSKRVERSSEDRRFLRSKLEDLHRALCMYQLSLDLVAQKGMLDYKEMLDAEVLREAKNELFTPFAELSSLYRIYAKEMNDEIDAVVAAGALMLGKVIELKSGSISIDEFLETHKLCIVTVSKAKLAVEDLISIHRLIPLRQPTYYWGALRRHVKRLEERRVKKAIRLREDKEIT